MKEIGRIKEKEYIVWVRPQKEMICEKGYKA